MVEWNLKRIIMGLCTHLAEYIDHWLTLVTIVINVRVL